MNLKVVLICSLAITAAMSVGQSVRVTRKYGTTETMNKVRPGMGVNSNDRGFFKQAVDTNLLEIKLGELAQKRGSNEWTREFGKSMVTEHTQGYNELKVIGWKTKMPVTKKLSPAAQATYSRLARLSGPAFDREYRATMMKGHDAFAKKIEQEIKWGNNSLVRNYAITMGPVVSLHHKMAMRKVTKI
jgi:putative membrane protein